MAKDRWSLRNIYMYLVCLITLIMVIVAVVGLVQNTVRLIFPEVGYYYYDTPVPAEDGAKADEEQIAKQQELDQLRARQQAIYEVVGNLAMLLVAGPLYIYHWRKIEVEHVDKPEQSPEPAV